MSEPKVEAPVIAGLDDYTDHRSTCRGLIGMADACTCGYAGWLMSLREALNAEAPKPEYKDIAIQYLAEINDYGVDDFPVGNFQFQIDELVRVLARVAESKAEAPGLTRDLMANQKNVPLPIKLALKNVWDQLGLGQRWPIVSVIRALDKELTNEEWPSYGDLVQKHANQRDWIMKLTEALGKQLGLTGIDVSPHRVLEVARSRSAEAPKPTTEFPEAEFAQGYDKESGLYNWVLDAAQWGWDKAIIFAENFRRNFDIQCVTLAGAEDELKQAHARIKELEAENEMLREAAKSVVDQMRDNGFSKLIWGPLEGAMEVKS